MRWQKREFLKADSENRAASLSRAIVGNFTYKSKSATRYVQSGLAMERNEKRGTTFAPAFHLTKIQFGSTS